MTRNLRLRFWLGVMDAAFFVGAWSSNGMRWRLYEYAIGKASRVPCG